MNTAHTRLHDLVQRHAALALPEQADRLAEPASANAHDVAYAAARRLGFIEADAAAIARAWQRRSEREGSWRADWPSEAQDFGLLDPPSSASAAASTAPAATTLTGSGSGSGSGEGRRGWRGAGGSRCRARRVEQAEVLRFAGPIGAPTALALAAALPGAGDGGGVGFDEAQAARGGIGYVVRVGAGGFGQAVGLFGQRQRGVALHQVVQARVGGVHVGVRPAFQA